MRPRAKARGQIPQKRRVSAANRGISDEFGDKLSWESCNWTLTPSAPIKTLCSATYRVSSVQQRAKVQIFRVSSRFSFLFVIFM
jgi:hypothetical protein